MKTGQAIYRARLETLIALFIGDHELKEVMCLVQFATKSRVGVALWAHVRS